MNKQDVKTMQELVRKPELYLGMATLIVFSIFIVKAVYKPAMKNQTAQSISVTPTLTPTKAVTAKQVITPKTEVKKTIKQVTKFADTGIQSILVVEGDSYWKIAEKTCGNGVIAESIKQENGYGEESLQPGDRVVVSCN